MGNRKSKIPPKRLASKDRKRKSRLGFTLIEALVAMAVVAIILPLAMAGISLALTLGSDARHRSEAATLASSKLDELVATGDWQLGLLSGDFQPDHPDYRWSATVQSWGDGTVDELEVQVFWTAQQHERSVTLGTLINPGNT